MFSEYQQWEDYEDELYCQEDQDDSGLSEPDSELEFRLYSQLHYSTEDQGRPEDQGGAGVERPEEEPLEPGQGTPLAAAGHCQEVIVIDSGPDAITISDTEDEESVCTLKGQGLRGCSRVNRKGSASAVPPPRPFRREKSRNVTEDVVVLDSDTEKSSDSCSLAPFVEDLESDSDSDSDALESWMILGQGKEDGDQDIQLNLDTEGAGGMPVFDKNSNDGDDHQNWVISDKDKEAQIFNKGLAPRRLSKRYYTEKNITCHSCNKVGHLSKNCPNPKKPLCCSLCGLQGHWVKRCPNRPCSNCSLMGHAYDDCLDRPYWHKRCFRCTMIGHFANDCPEIWRQYHLTTVAGLPVKAINPKDCRSPAYCYNCSKIGHFGHECLERRMFNGTYPTLPLICSYDTMQDVRRREHWAQKRAKDLQEAGLLGSTEAPPSDQPLQKKQKTNPRNTFPPHTPANHGPKRRIAHTPKHHPQTTPDPNKPSHFQQGMTTPSQKATPPLQHTPTFQLQGKKKKKKKKKNNNKNNNPAIFGDDDFPRGFRKNSTSGGTPPAFRGAHSPGMLFSSGKRQEKSQKKKNKAQKRARKASGSRVGDDENLFIIKQRKRSR